MTKSRQTERASRVEAAVLEAVAPFSANGALRSLDTPLFEGGLGLDSIDFLELVFEIEGKLGLNLRSEELTGEAIKTLGGLVDHIASVMAKRRGVQPEA